MTTIVHDAIISDISGEFIVAEMSRKEACESCAIKHACGQSGEQHKITIKSDKASSYQVGQHIKVEISQSQALYAVFWGYVAPLLLVLSVLAMSYIFFKSEEISAVCSLLGVILYYVLLWLMRKHFQKILQIKIR